jgi:hypothetical protein
MWTLPAQPQYKVGGCKQRLKPPALPPYIIQVSTLSLRTLIACVLLPCPSSTAQILRTDRIQSRNNGLRGVLNRADQPVPADRQDRSYSTLET